MNILQVEMDRLLADVEAILPSVTWTRGPSETEIQTKSEDPTVQPYLGTAPGGWRFTVVSFDIEPQGFPPGSRGYDGAAVHGPRIIRLTRQLAERAFQLADARH